jgi:Sulfotransferase domain
MSNPKELDFFVDNQAAGGNWLRGISWYRSHFDPEARVRGEASPSYTAYLLFDGVSERMASIVPDARLVYLIRDPLERIAAHWVHKYAKRQVKGTLAETLADPETPYVARSMYWLQLERYLHHYEREQMLVIEQSELRHRRPETVRRVFEFLGVDPEFTDSRFEQEIHQTSRKVRETRLALRLNQLGQSPRPRLLSTHFWVSLAARLPRRTIKPPDVTAIAAALPPKTLARLRLDGERLRDFTGHEYADWTLWDA